MTKVEDLTNEQLDVLVATCVMGWTLEEWKDGGIVARGADGTIQCWTFDPEQGRLWEPSTDIACAFQVDKPEWRWHSDEIELYDDNADGHLTLDIWLEEVVKHRRQLADMYIPLDPANKTAAYCRGRCIAALKACGVTEV